ncbi:MAG: hypothetical protein HQL86_03360 [Magnetococcales bacterium]|nr:hypothetical protein [Magnetococcales bacterium]
MIDLLRAGGVEKDDLAKILDPAVAGNHLRQTLDPYGKSEASLITDKVTSVSYNSPYEPIC